MYLRFAIQARDRNSHRGIGIFQVACVLRDQGNLADWEHKRLIEILDWFNQNLEKPHRFTASKPPYYRKQSKAISWFKASATEHIERAREISMILERHGIIVELHRTERVGYIVYEDVFQVVAEPFSDTNC